MTVTEPKTEFYRQPLGIDVRQPAFSWQLEGENTFQKTYRISVATDPALIESETPDLWDSGTVSSDQTLVIYGGKPLESCTRYYWRVEADGAKSEITWFETAFLDPAREFVADWIGQPLGFSGSVDDIRFDFEVDKPVRRARFYVAALGTGRFYLNGALLDDGYFDGAVSVYRKTIYYRTYELHYRMGKNCLCARIGYGFYGAKKLYGVLRTEFEDGSISVTPTFAGRAWNVKRDPVRMNGVYDGEYYDARLEEDWMNPDYRVTFGNWVAAFAADPPGGAFKANPIPPMRVTECAPARVSPAPYGWSVDAGANLCGFLKITVSGERGAKIVLKHAERLLPDGGLDNANYRAAECTDTYVLKGEGTETFAPEFTYHGFQFAEIRAEGKVSLLAVTVCALRSAVAPCGSFACSDETLNRLHEIAVRTEGNNLNGTFTDCPQRDERLGWLNDLTSRMYQSVFNFSLERYLANQIDMITEEQDTSGVIPDTVPFGVGAKKADFISAYIVLGVLHYRFYGDRRVLERNYGGFVRWMNVMRADADAHGGTAEYGIYGDWCPAKIYAAPGEQDTFSRFVPIAYMSAAYFLWYLACMEEIAGILGKEKDAAQFAGEYRYYRERFDRKYYDAGTGLYGGGSQTECAVALTAVKGADPALAKAAADDIAARGYHTTCGNQGYRHLMFRLGDHGYAETVVSLLKNPEDPGWGFMLQKGATSVWERWEDSVGSDMHSFDHPMFTAYDGFFYQYLAGIRADLCRDAFGEIVIRPAFVAQLSWVRCRFETVRGAIEVAWERRERDIELKITTPANTRLTVQAEGRKLTCGTLVSHGELRLTNGTFAIAVEC